MGSSAGRVAKKSSKKHKIKESLKKVVNYLKSISYMYAPLVSPQFLPNNPTFITAWFKETTKGEELGEKKMLRKVGDYLKSDTYMYAPLTIDPPRASSLSSPPIFKFTTGGAQHQTAEVKMVGKTNLHLKHTEQAGAYSSSTNTLVRHTLSYSQTVKHIIPQNCRSSFVSGESVESRGRLLE